MVGKEKNTHSWKLSLLNYESAEIGESPIGNYARFASTKAPELNGSALKLYLVSSISTRVIGSFILCYYYVEHKIQFSQYGFYRQK